MKWLYEQRVDAAHAWGVVAVGTAGLVAIPTILATLHATDSHFRWWWPSNWMILPAAIFLVGLGLTVLPVMRPVNTPQASTETFRATTVGDSGSMNISGDDRDADGELPKAMGPRESALRSGSDPAISKTLSRVRMPAQHAFISYVHEDASHADQLQRDLEASGISVWRDTADLWPGEDWRMKIRRAITDNALVFIACFSTHSIARVKSRQNEELTLAIDQLRMRRPDTPWLIPIRFDDCSVPDYELGGGRTLASIQGADLFGVNREAGVKRLLTIARQLLGSDKQA